MIGVSQCVENSQDWWKCLLGERRLVCGERGSQCSSGCVGEGKADVPGARPGTRTEQVSLCELETLGLFLAPLLHLGGHRVF